MSAENGHPKEHQLILMPSGRRGYVADGTNILDAARSLGVEIESICGGKLTCGKCSVRIEDGEFQKHGITSSAEHISPITEEEIKLLKRMKRDGQRLSCQACVTGDVLAFVPEESRAAKQVIRKSATDRPIDIKPTVRKLYIEVDRAELGEHRGDWGRVQDALEQQWGLHTTTADLHVLQKLQEILRKDGWKITCTVWNDTNVIDVDAGYTEGTYGLAVDIGSTTVGWLSL